MTEQEWLTATDPQPLLRFLRRRLNNRKSRLLIVSWHRLVSHVLTDRESREALEINERFADDLATPAELAEAKEQVSATSRRRAEYYASDWAHWVAVHSLYFLRRPAQQYRLVTAVGQGVVHALGSSHTRVKETQAKLCREVYGNPFCPVTLDRSWLTPTVTGLAAAVYEERQLPSGLFDNGRLAVLADALEEDGCDNRDLLSHLRNGGEHVRGCWVVDLVLGKS